MIVFIVTAEHTYTLEPVVGLSRDATVRIATYDQMFALKEAPLHTYVFADVDRLSRRRLESAAKLYRMLKRGGARVLNDPARIPTRFGLLRMLHRQGLNGFDAWRVEDEAMPDRWPVFLRTEGDHGGEFSALLYNPQEVSDAVARAIESGLPRANLVLIEFASDPVRPGLYRKLSVMRLGDAYIPFWSVTAPYWDIQGSGQPADEALYEEEQRFVREDAFVEALKPAFELAGVEYGRADFGLVNGRPQVWEINVNPDMKAFGLDHESALRSQTLAMVQRRFLEALPRIDTPTS